MADDKIIWETVQGLKYDACANRGDQATTEEVGYLESEPNKKFVRFRLLVAIYNDHLKGMDYQIISQQVIPLF